MVPCKRDVLRMVTAALGYVALGVIGMELALTKGGPTPVWPAAGWAVFAAFRWSKWGVCGVISGAVLLHLWVTPEDLFKGYAAIYAIGFGVGLSAALSGLYLRSHCDRAGFLRLNGPKDVFSFLCLCAFLPNVLLASIGTVTEVLAGSLEKSEVFMVGATWTAADTLGVVILVPVILARKTGFNGNFREGILFCFVCALLTWIIFQEGNPAAMGAAFGLFAFLVLFVRRYGLPMVGLSIIGITLVAIYQNSLGRGPFYVSDGYTGDLVVQACAAVLSIGALMVASRFSHIRNLRSDLRRVEKRPLTR